MEQLSFACPQTSRFRLFARPSVLLRNSKQACDTSQRLSPLVSSGMLNLTVVRFSDTFVSSPGIALPLDVLARRLVRAIAWTFLLAP